MLRALFGATSLHDILKMQAIAFGQSRSLTSSGLVLSLRQKMNDWSRRSHLIWAGITQAFRDRIPRCTFNVHTVNHHAVWWMTFHILGRKKIEHIEEADRRTTGVGQAAGSGHNGCKHRGRRSDLAHGCENHT